VEVYAIGVRKKKASGSRGPKWKVLEHQGLSESWSMVSGDSVIGSDFGGNDLF
jgi:hypothetical protein